MIQVQLTFISMENQKHKKAGVGKSDSRAIIKRYNNDRTLSKLYLFLVIITEQMFCVTSCVTFAYPQETGDIQSLLSFSIQGSSEETIEIKKVAREGFEPTTPRV